MQRICIQSVKVIFRQDEKEIAEINPGKKVKLGELKLNYAYSRIFYEFATALEDRVLVTLCVDF